ncbi:MULTISPECIES: GNAT family N-acetyltransferase [unclassified Pannonibacter]|uniref:GNAT family N-acetyltransferase n=1 Tax=unclassified Pannonibacter TaxID=2627228 RepID=UPI0016471342|nr:MULTISPECIES: GNAT family N-acetyltransferase [unclassified Pannonibacter]
MQAALNDHLAEVPEPKAARLVRPMRQDDLPVVAGLFGRVFRPSGVRDAAALEAYLGELLFGSPSYSEASGSLVHDHPSSGVTAAVLSVPMTFNVEGARVTARLLCSFMSEGREGRSGAARISGALRAKRQDFLLSDSASPLSAKHWIAVGGQVLTTQSLEWRRILRPVSAARVIAGQRLPRLRPLLALLPCGAVDVLARRLKPALVPEVRNELSVEETDAAVFLKTARPLLSRFPVHPLWPDEEFAWLTGLAAQNLALGTLRFGCIRDASGVFAALAWYTDGRKATVLHLLTEEGREFDAVTSMLAAFEAAGHVIAEGMAQPFLMRALLSQRWISFSPRGFFCIGSRFSSVNDAARRGDLYAGGFASESWSRLLTDL